MSDEFSQLRKRETYIAQKFALPKLRSEERECFFDEYAFLLRTRPSRTEGEDSVALGL